MTDREIRKGDRVRCWPGVRPGRHYDATALTDVAMHGSFGTAGAYVAKDAGGTDYIAASHLQRTADTND